MKYWYLVLRILRRITSRKSRRVVPTWPDSPKFSYTVDWYATGSDFVRDRTEVKESK